MNGFGEVLVARNSLLKIEALDMKLATTPWLSLEYCFVGWLVPVVLATVRR